MLIGTDHTGPLHVDCLHLEVSDLVAPSCAGGRIGLLDYGQSKQLPEHVRLSLAKLMLELGRGQTHARRDVVAKLLHEMGLRFSRPADDIQTMMAFGMFDSQLSHRYALYVHIWHLTPDLLAWC